MTRVAWILAVFAVIGAFIAGQAAKNSVRDDRADADKRLEKLRKEVTLTLAEAQGSLEKLEAKYRAFESGTAEALERHQEVKASWDELESSIGASERAIERLAAEKTSAKDSKKRDMEEVREVQGQIVTIEKQIAALKVMMPLVKVTLSPEDN